MAGDDFPLKKRFQASGGRSEVVIKFTQIYKLVYKPHEYYSYVRTINQSEIGVKNAPT